MQTKFTTPTWVVVGVLLCAAFPVQAQQKGRIITKALDAALTRRVTAQASAKLPAFDRSLGVRGFNRSLLGADPLFGKHGYNPVLGFQTNLSEEAFHPLNGIQTTPVDYKLQVQPVLRQAEALDAFVDFDKVTLPQLTQAIYLWRLANPTASLEENGVLATRAQELIQKETMSPFGQSYQPHDIDELPNITFLKRLLDPKFTPKTYGQLAEETKVYPKYVTLDVYGFPVRTAQAEQAQLLDNYLMLSHPKVMGNFNAANGFLSDEYRGKSGNFMAEPAFTPFVLTREEHAAADELLAKRHEIDKVPEHPTARQLIEISYNRLETYNEPYTSPEVDSMKDIGYIAYPGYVHTKLRQKIQELINQADLTSERESTDISHLVVLDGIMDNGIFDGSIAKYNRVLDSFEKLCKEIPTTPENVAHLQRLHDVLLMRPDLIQFMNASEIDVPYYVIEDPEAFVWESKQLQARLKRFASIKVAQLMKVKAKP